MNAHAEDGYTLIELIVVAILIAAALPAAIAIVVSLNNSASSQLSQAQIVRQVSEVDSQLARDLAAIRPCHPSRIGPTITAIGPGSLTMTVDHDLDGTVEHVTWTVADGGLTRQVAVDDGTCTPTGAFTPSPLLSSANPTSNDGLWVTRTTDGLACDQPCDADHLHIDLEVVAADGVTLPLQRTLPIPDGRARR